MSCILFLYPLSNTANLHSCFVGWCVLVVCDNVFSPGYMQDFRMLWAPIVLHSMEHKGICNVMQHFDAVGDFTVTFVLDLGKQLFEHLTVTVCIDCVPTWKQGFLSVPVIQLGRIHYMVYQLHAAWYYTLYSPVNCTVNTSICWCVYQVKHIALPFRRPQQCLEWWFSVVHASYHTQYLVYVKSEILLKSLVWFPHE